MTTFSLLYENKLTRSCTVEKQNKTMRANFGDGYSQRCPAGTNALKETWKLTWAGLSESQKDEVVGLLDEVAGWNIIRWQPLYEDAVKSFIVKDGKYSYGTGNKRHYTVSCELVRVYDQISAP